MRVMSPPTAWRCVPANARDIRSMLNEYREQVHAMQSAYSAPRLHSTRVEASSAISTSVVQTERGDGDGGGGDSDECSVDNTWIETGSGPVSDAEEEDDLDRMEDAAEAMRPSKPPRMCSHVGCETRAVVKVCLDTDGVTNFACMEHGLRPSVLLQLLNAVLKTDEGVFLKYIHNRPDDGEAFGERMDRAFSFFCATDDEPRMQLGEQTPADAADAGTGPWQHDAATIKALARTMGVLLKGVKRDEGRQQLQLLLQQTPQVRDVALQVRERIHEIMLSHQEELELLMEEQECEADRVAITSKYIETEATEDVDMCDDAHSDVVEEVD